MTEKIVEKDVEITEVIEPAFISLVDKPSNQIAFKIVRSDEEGKTKMVKRTRKSDSPLMMLMFPDEMGEEEVQSFMQSYGFTDYEADTMDGKKVMRKVGQKQCSDTFTVTLQEGVKAYIARAEGKKEGLVLSSIEFALDYYTSSEEAQDWIKRNNLDIPKNNFETSESVIIAKRCDAGEKEVRRVQIDDGVIAVVYRDDMMDVPESMNGVCEAAYGSYGWGQLDFGAALADEEFCEAANEATYLLQSVARNILFYSQLPVSQRKDLLQNAASQFATYIGSLLDALPTQVIAAARRDMTKEKQMSDQTKAAEVKTEVAEEVKREDEVKTETKVEETKAPAYVTREDMEAAISAAVAKALEGVKAPAAEVKREDEKKEDAPQDKVVAALEAIAQRMEKIESQTVVRSDRNDGTAEKAADPFKGIFG